ncbi:hypothetical protein Zmor_027805 [Zophobas morio]|uniref:Uncharacterized protein n=1 Tax=Zophobas morio TaxID=2755281 RepID=A0AA38HPB3_9CUCU|nr:hypothetical protein Zmor_027805 [Zophobas morio]
MGCCRRATLGSRPLMTDELITGTPNRKRRAARTEMMRLLGMRLVTRLLLLVCSLSLISLLFLSRCGLSGLDTSAVMEETESQPGVVSGLADVRRQRSPDVFERHCRAFFDAFRKTESFINANGRLILIQFQQTAAIQKRGRGEGREDKRSECSASLLEHASSLFQLM